MELNEKYRIVYDSENVILQFHEQREKNVWNAELKTYEGTGEFREHTENYYYPGMESALRGFLRKCTWNTEFAEEILEKLDKIQETIKSLKIKN